jgi:acetyltransferase-like isoleucine patch superfamily enzyme
MIYKIENLIVVFVVQFKSYFRSFLLFGNVKKIKFGRLVRLSVRKLSVGNNILIGDYSDLRGKEIIIEDNVIIHENVLIRSNNVISIGKGTTINRNCNILANVKIGKGCSIAANVVIVGSNHVFKSKIDSIKSQGIDSKGILIEDDVWIGANCTVLDGVVLGEGCIVAAGAVVNKSIEPYSIVGGVPSKHIKTRG